MHDLIQSAHEQLRNGNPRAALELLQDVADHPDAPPTLAATFAWSLIQLGDFGTAAAHVSAKLDAHPDTPSLLMARSYALERLGATREALRDASRTLEIAPDHPEAGVASARLAMALDKPEWAMAFAADAARRYPDNWHAQHQLAVAADKLGHFDVARASAEAVCTILTDQSWPWLWLAQLQQKDGLFDEAFASAKRAGHLASGDAGQRANAFGLAATILPRLVDRGQVRAFSDEIDGLDGLQAMPEWLMRLFYRVHLQADQPERARRLQSAIDAERAGSFAGATLAQSLARIRASDPPLSSPAPAVALAWSLANHAAWTEPEWQRETARGLAASTLVTEWWDSMPGRRNEIDALVDVQHLEALRLAAARGRGYVIVTAHVGPAFAGLRALHANGFMAQMVHMADYLANEPDSAGSRAIPDINLAMDQQKAVREMLATLKSGGGIVTAADNAQARDATDFPFLNRTARISTMAPRLAWRYGAATVWMVSQWRGSRIVVSFEELPRPGTGEAEEAFAARWVAAYLARIEDCLRGAPQNLNIGSGIWESLTA